MGDLEALREQFAETYTNGGLMEVSRSHLEEAREHFREIFGDKQTLKWTLLLAFRGGFYLHNLNSYYPTADDENLANYHRKYFRDMGLIVEIKEQQFNGQAWEEERKYLKRRRNPNKDTDDFNIEDLAFNEGVPDAQIRKLVDEIGKGETTDKDEKAYFNTGNSREWIFLTPIGDEVLKGIFGSGVSFSLPMRAATESEYPQFLYCLPKLTQIGYNRYLPNLYRFALDDVNVTDYSEVNSRHVIPKNEISRKIISDTENADQVTVILPWLPNENVCKHIHDSDFETTVIVGNRITDDYRDGNQVVRQRINESLLSGDSGMHLAENELPEDLELRSFRNPLPYVMVHSSSSSQAGKLLIHAEGDRDEPRGPLLVRTDETEDPEDLYSWAADLCKKLESESKPLSDVLSN